MSANINTCALLALVQLSADAIWEDAAKNKDYIANVASIQAIRDNQTVQIKELENPDKDKTVTVYWPENCNIEVASCSDDCSPGGQKPGTRCQDYTLNLCKTASFSLDEKVYRSIATNKEEAMAVSMLEAMKALDNYIASQTVSTIDSGKGVNAYTSGKGTVSGFKTNIPAAYWNGSLFGYLNLVSQYNKFNAPYILSGTNLYEAYWNAQMNAGNADGKGTKNMFDAYKIYFDIFNLDTVLSPDKATYLLNRNALAFHSKVYYPWNSGDARANQWGGPGSEVGYRYSVDSKNLPGVKYDVIHKISCSSNEITHKFTLQFTGGIFRNPVGCNQNDSNILKFVCS